MGVSEKSEENEDVWLCSVLIIHFDVVQQKKSFLFTFYLFNLRKHNDSFLLLDEFHRCLELLAKLCGDEGVAFKKTVGGNS